MPPHNVLVASTSIVLWSYNFVQFNMDLFFYEEYKKKFYLNLSPFPYCVFLNINNTEYFIFNILNAKTTLFNIFNSGILFMLFHTSKMILLGGCIWYFNKMQFISIEKKTTARTFWYGSVHMCLLLNIE